MANLLYRGVSKVDDLENTGRVWPKGSASEVTPLYDGQVTYNGWFNHGPSKTNTARVTQSDKITYDNSGISTSRSLSEAIKFATYGGQDGFIYVIDADRLAQEGVTAVEFPDPEHPHEREVTLIVNSREPLPLSLIVEKFEVHSEGRRI